MRHRIGIAAYTGLGNLSPEMLPNVGLSSDSRIKVFNEVLRAYFSKYGYCDYYITDEKATFGIEPAYQHDRLRIISIHKDKLFSYIQNGFAFGYYGSEIGSTTKRYSEYKKKCKFTKCIDKWHKQLYENKNT